MAAHGYKEPVNPDLQERLTAYKLKKAKQTRLNWGVVIVFGILVVAGIVLYFGVQEILQKLHA